MLTLVLIGLSLVWGSFNIWKNMRAEYTAGEIFLFTTVLSLVGLLSLWWPYLGLLVGLVWVGGWCKYQKWDFWEWLDLLAPLSLLVTAVVVWGGGWDQWPIAVVALAGWWLVTVLGQFYRQFGWYPSGRLGFVGLVALGWWGVVQLMVANISLPAVYCLAAVVILTVLAVYLRSGNKWPKVIRLTRKKPKP